MEQYPRDAVIPQSGGGVLRDFGSHVIDQALLLFGPARSVYAEVNLLPEQEGLDNRFFCALHHRSGVSSHLWGDWTLQGAPSPRFRVAGSAGTFVIESDDGQTDLLLSGRTPATEGEGWGRVAEARWGRLYRAGDAGAGATIATEPGNWNAFYSSFGRAVRGEAPVPVDPWQVVAALRVLDAARASAADGRVVKL
jgi:predicted dehydrogenase